MLSQCRLHYEFKCIILILLFLISNLFHTLLNYYILGSVHVLVVGRHNFSGGKQLFKVTNKWNRATFIDDALVFLLATLKKQLSSENRQDIYIGIFLHFWKTSVILLIYSMDKYMFSLMSSVCIFELRPIIGR